jgi:hypothetical protein
MATQAQPALADFEPTAGAGAGRLDGGQRTSQELISHA